jgi:hypothetical protein
MDVAEPAEKLCEPLVDQGPVEGGDVGARPGGVEDRRSGAKPRPARRTSDVEP